jgi:transposase
LGRDRVAGVEVAGYVYFEGITSSSSRRSVDAVSLAGLGGAVGEAGAVAARSVPSLPSSRSPAPSSARLSGGDPVRALHGHPLAGGALPGARPAERRDLPPAAGGVAAAGTARGGLAGAAAGIVRGGAARLVARDRRCLAGRGEKGGAQVARTLLGRPGSRYHLAVDAHGAPLEVRLSAGNEHEGRHLLPLIDALCERGLKPGQVWADRGYDSQHLRAALAEREIEPCISRRRPRGQPLAADQPRREVWRGRTRQVKVPDPQARHRWPVERTNAWLKAKRRIATRRDRKPENYLAFLHLGMILILANAL